MNLAKYQGIVSEIVDDLIFVECLSEGINLPSKEFSICLQDISKPKDLEIDTRLTLTVDMDTSKVTGYQIVSDDLYWVPNVKIDPIDYIRSGIFDKF